MYNYDANDLIKMWQLPDFKGKVKLSCLDNTNIINGILVEIRRAISEGLIERDETSWVTTVSNRLPPFVKFDDIYEVYEKSPLWVNELKKCPTQIEDGKIMDLCSVSPLYSLELLDLLRKNEDVSKRACMVSKNPILKGRQNAWQENIAMEIAVRSCEFYYPEVIFSSALLNKSILELEIDENEDYLLKQCFNIAKQMYDEYEAFKGGKIDYSNLNPEYLNIKTFEDVIDDIISEREFDV